MTKRHIMRGLKMKKKILLIFALIIVVAVSAISFAMGDSIVANSNRFDNAPFSNGYNGFCLDFNKSTDVGAVFTAAGNTSAATNNKDNSDISQKIKVMFIENFETLFAPDGSGNYVMTDSNSAQIAIYNFTGDYGYASGVAKQLVDSVANYSGPTIPDEGYTITLDNGDVITFSFMVLVPEDEEHIQYFFAYKLGVNKVPAHEHDFDEKWESDEDSHWHECECGETANVGEHEAELRNDKPAKEFEEGYTGDEYCKVCDELLKKGEVIPMTHVHDYKLKHDKDHHWRECSCDLEDKIVDNAEHEGELRNKKEPTESEKGYTGDEYCKHCERLLQEGEPIPAVGGDTPENTTPEDKPEDITPADKSEAQKPETNTPVTGDNSNLFIWTLLASVMAAGTVLSLNFRKK